MRIVLAMCALAGFGGALLAQAPDSQAVGPARPVETPSAAGAPLDSLRLTRAQAIAEALAHNPQLEVARELTAQARARRIEATAIPDPALTASYDDQTQFGRFGTAGGKNVGVAMDIPFPDKFRLQNKVAVGDIRANEYNYQLTRQLIAFATSTAFDSVLLALRHRADLQMGRQLSADFLKRTQARFDAGTAAKLDVIKAQVELAQADNDLIANERDIANAQASLNRLIGHVIGTPIAAEGDLDMPPPLPDSTTIEQIALERRPEIAILSAEERGAQAATSLAKEYWLPDITVGASRDYTQPGSPLFSTGIALPLPTFFWQQTKGQIAEASHHERELAASLRDLRAQVTQDVRSAYANASTTMRQVVFIHDQLLPAAQEAFRVASTSYALGGSSALEVLDARRTLLDAQSQLAEALAAANTARADLERALGTSLQNDGASKP